MIAEDECEENVHLIAHTKLTAQDSCLSEITDFDDDLSSPNDITLKEVIEEEEEEGQLKDEDHPPKKTEMMNGGRIESDSRVENLELNHIGESIEGSGADGEKESNVDERKPLSPIEKKLSRQELLKSDQERPTVNRKRFTTQRDPFHKDRAPRKSVLKRTNHPNPVTTFESTSPSVSPTGNDDDDEANYDYKQQQQLDRKCCVVM